MTIEYYYENAEKLTPDLETLTKIHTLFVHQTRFNSLSVNIGLKSEFDTAAAYQKVVVDGIGDTCRVTNLAAMHVLKKIGYQVHCIKTNLVHAHSTPIPEDKIDSSFHMALIVTFKDDENNRTQYLFDPAFGNGTRVPLPLTGEVVKDYFHDYKIIYNRELLCYEFCEKHDEWYVQFRFDPDKKLEEKDYDDYVMDAYQDDKVFRNNLFIVKCDYDYVLMLLNDEIIEEFPDGTSYKKSVLLEGGIKRVMIKRFHFPKKFVDSIDIDSELITPSLRKILKRSWTVSPLENIRLKIKAIFPKYMKGAKS